jgi:DNA-binding IclR family transcriptional regulator
MKRFTKNTIVSPAKLKSDLEAIRKQGYSKTEGEWQAGVLGFATAIRAPGGEIAGAIGVAGPEDRMRKSDLDRTVKALRHAGERIEAELKASAAEGAKQDETASGAGNVARARKATARKKR